MQAVPAQQPSKALLRKDLLARRQAQGQEAAQAASRAIQGRIAALPAFAAAHEVLLYMPVRGEADTGLLLDALLARGARVLLPRCRPGRPGEMSLHCVTCRSQLIPGSYAIPEPDPGRCAPADDFSPDVALVPGVAFDRRGRRLGYGGGYYDRLLAHPAMAGTLLVAPAFAFQVVQSLPADPWDRPVHLLVTEHESIETRP